MINNSGKVAAIFGVRNEESIAYNIALKLHQSGCKIALSYVEDTRDEVLYLLEKLGLDTTLAMQVDVRDEAQINNFLSAVYSTYGPINYILHGVAYANTKVLCSNFLGSSEPVPEYINIPFEDLMDSFNISAYSLLRIARVAESMLEKNASILTLTYNAANRVIPQYGGMAINKAALDNIMLYLASYFRNKEVRVNAISANG